MRLLIGNELGMALSVDTDARRRGATKGTGRMTRERRLDCVEVVVQLFEFGFVEQDLVVDLVDILEVGIDRE